MSNNFFAALDTSDDEDAKKVAKKTAKKASVIEPSKTDERRRTQKGNDRNTKHGRGGRPPPSRQGKRQYDRRSGTGRGREIKKDGGGAHNWGSNESEARNGMTAEEAAEEVTETEGAEETALEEVPEDEPEPEPEVQTMSYEDYMAAKKEAAASETNQAFKPVQERKVDDSAFAGAKAKVAVEEDFFGGGGGKQKRVRANKKASQAATELELGFRAGGGDSGGGRGGRGRGGRGRGDRDGGRGRGGGRDGGGRGYGGRGRSDGRRGGGRGGGRGDGRGRSGRRGGGGGLNVRDEQAFPSL